MNSSSIGLIAHIIKHKHILSKNMLRIGASNSNFPDCSFIKFDIQDNFSGANWLVRHADGLSASRVNKAFYIPFKIPFAIF